MRLFDFGYTMLSMILVGMVAIQIGYGIAYYLLAGISLGFGFILGYTASHEKWLADTAERKNN